MLVSFLVVFLLYCVYYPLRFSIEDPERQARYSSVFAIAAGAFVPLNFIAVRLAEAYTHPRVLSQTGGNLPGEMRLTFLVSLLAIALLFVTLWKLELTAKHASMQLKLRRDSTEPCPRCRLTRPGKYVAGAYVVFLALILIYVAIIAAKIARIDREITELTAAEDDE